ncbi:L,D-transpeptidase [Rhodococcus sp. D2-41]|uniref:Ig-like domain-containing protein n=1 Tax=Speluncibacter jeojiensis TaxID=2710754 RepID=A0A9X4RFN1_9ACTN|nr:Ig-like domain-containing protein [Rhodococcus sp. D2-41]MDG3009585.1 L,D-transpeptidase [Rhodococcus sp. D2-41]MDG3016789.1 Ig-like domain-containing protein [Corynebacteriales bacterium D3-21]
MAARKILLGGAALSMIALVATGCRSTSSTGTAAPAESAPAAAITVPVAGATPINPTTPIVVNVADGQLTKVTVTNPAENGKVVTGTLSPNRQSWSTDEALGYGAGYSVVADAVNAAGKPTEKTFTVQTMNPASTAYANVVPAPDLVAQSGIGVGQPMVFQFTAPVVNKAEVQKHLHITVTPPQPGAWYWVDDKDVHYRGPNYWLPGTKIHIEADVYGLDLGNGVYGAENNSADYTVHDSWVAKADGNTEELTVFHNGVQVNQMPMSLGSPGHPSHEGPHVISDKQPSIVMDSCTYGVCEGQPGYYKETVYKDLRISNDGEFVHSAPWSVGEQGSSNVSHGCVNLSPDNAQWMYDHFNIGDVVEITNSGGPELPAWDTYGDWDVPWSTWQAGDANS